MNRWSELLARLKFHGLDGTSPVAYSGSQSYTLGTTINPGGGSKNEVLNALKAIYDSSPLAMGTTRQTTAWAMMTEKPRQA